MRVELDPDHAGLVDVHGHGSLELTEDLVAHELIIGPVGDTRWTGGKAAALDEREPLLGGASPGDKERSGTHARGIVWVLARPVEHALLVGLEAGRQGRERVGLGGERSGEEAHGKLREAIATQALNRAPCKWASLASRARRRRRQTKGPRKAGPEWHWMGSFRWPL